MLAYRTEKDDTSGVGPSSQPALARKLHVYRLARFEDEPRVKGTIMGILLLEMAAGVVPVMLLVATIIVRPLPGK